MLIQAGSQEPLKLSQAMMARSPLNRVAAMLPDPAPRRRWFGHLPRIVQSGTALLRLAVA